VPDAAVNDGTTKVNEPHDLGRMSCGDGRSRGRRSLTADHPDTQKSRNNLADAYRQRDDPNGDGSD